MESFASLISAAIPSYGVPKEDKSNSRELPIPGPTGLPLVGSASEFSQGHPLENVLRMADIYGPIFRFKIGSSSRVIVSSRELVHDCCDQSRFQKSVKGSLSQVRNGVHDGLFTAKAHEPRWGVAHRILIPAFGPVSMHGMFDDMYDIASQLALKWARNGPQVSIPVTDDFTRLTLDTLALCSMDFRFNSYYSDTLHPFVDAMSDFLAECGRRYSRLGVVQMLQRSAEKKYWEDISLMQKTAHHVLKYRREHPSNRKDLLTAMLEGVDPKTGLKMDDDSIVDNLITFLIAGHETTSGLLSFAFYEMLKKPETYQKAQAEVDAVIGREPIALHHLTKLPYIAAVLRETLRLDSPIPGFPLECIEETLIAGKYRVYPDEVVTCILNGVHRDPVVYGPDPLAFRPERMLDAEFEQRLKDYPDCWKPFGNGMRACIGRPFAWQEALLCTAMVLQNFNLVMDDPSYMLQLQHSLTVKPKDFHMRAILRHGLTATELEKSLHGRTTASQGAKPTGNMGSTSASNEANSGAKGRPMSIFYGSNSGTCEAMAHRLAADAASHGFRAATVDVLNAAKEKLPQDHPIVIITASYEGQPTDNAAAFVAWLEAVKGQEAQGVQYAVYACGHRDWVQTFHRIPKLIDEALEARGGTRLVAMGSTDASDRDMFSDFESWEDSTLWPALVQKYKDAGDDQIDMASSSALAPGLNVKISHPRTENLYQEVKESIVIDAQELATGEFPKNHIEIKLPSGVTYRAGDYLAVLPHNPADTVSRAVRAFSLNADAYITISGKIQTHLPVGKELPIGSVLSAYIELAQPATKRNITTLAKAATDPAEAVILTSLASEEKYATEITQKRMSILDLLEAYPSIDLPFANFLEMMPPMRVRLYSISSSPLWNPHHVTLTYSLLDEPSLSGHGRYIGTATNYLSSLRVGDRLHVAVRPSPTAFHLPEDPENVPIICIAAGSGIAPFRGFMQERATQIAAGRALAPALLYFGCRSPTSDDLYAGELAGWEAAGVVTVKRAYSRETDKSSGLKYVQHLLYDDRAKALVLWRGGAKVFVCGSGRMGKAVEETAIQIMLESAKEKGKNLLEEEAREKFAAMRNVRYATDVFD
ncbi:NADPH--cytochrome P450 reductase [Ceratocystis platani]|uniref:Bifunctional cytochrome P450/NADPH--P450 reductase n=1 Tax=Ceratocystis fimbriata f. sp. platani TaxID=88771 RepID=A0A0F8B5Z2_CERFI|nr:NADPH--cytochrome P450 reductase [Ceratocystis platani]